MNWIDFSSHNDKGTYTFTEVMEVYEPLIEFMLCMCVLLTINQQDALICCNAANDKNQTHTDDVLYD